MFCWSYFSLDGNYGFGGLQWILRSSFSIWWILAWIFPKWTLFQCLRAFLVALIFLQSINAKFPIKCLHQTYRIIIWLNASWIYNSSNLNDKAHQKCFVVLSRNKWWSNTKDVRCCKVASRNNNLHWGFAIPWSNPSLIKAFLCLLLASKSRISEANVN